MAWIPNPPLAAVRRRWTPEALYLALGWLFGGPAVAVAVFVRDAWGLDPTRISSLPGILALLALMVVLAVAIALAISAVLTGLLRCWPESYGGPGDDSGLPLALLALFSLYWLGKILTGSP